MRLRDLVHEILTPHLEKIMDAVEEEILIEVVDIVLESIYGLINDGKVRMEGVIDRETVHEKVLQFHSEIRERSKKLKQQGNENGTN